MKMRDIINTVQEGFAMPGEGVSADDQEQPVPPKREISVQELRKMLGAQRKRIGLWTIYDPFGSPEVPQPMFYNGIPVKFVLIHYGSKLGHYVEFFGAWTGPDKRLASFITEPITIDAKLPEGWQESVKLRDPKRYAGRR